MDQLLLKLFEFLATNRLLEGRLGLFTILKNFLPFILQIMLPEPILTFLAHLHVLVSL